MKSIKLAHTLFLQTLKNKKVPSLSEIQQTRQDQGPLCIIPGLFGSKQNWQSIGKALSKSLSRPVIALDMRNHGDSEHTATHTYDDMCRDMDHFVRENGFQNVDLMGHSMGGKIAMLLALHNPPWLKKTIIVDMSPVNQSTATSLFAGYVDAMKKAGIPALDKKSVDDYLKDHIPEVAVRQFLLTNLKKRDSDSKLEWKVNVNTIGEYLDHLWTFPIKDPRSRSFKDILFIKGAKSNYITEAMWPAIQSYFPNAKLASVPGAGHWVHSEKPKEFMTEVERFLK